jgi:hypothetical protein
MSKTCTSCGESKSTSDFHKRKGAPGGLSYVCKECTKQRNAAHYKVNADSINRRGYDYRKANAVHIKQRKAVYRKVNADRIKQRDAIYRKKARAEAFEAYGGMICTHCGETNLNCLTLDHIEQDGAEQRRNGQSTGGVLYVNLRKRGFPPGFRVLCFNCNWKTWLKHNRKNLSNGEEACRAREQIVEYKKKAFGVYGGIVCALCGEIDIDILSLDHTNGGGNKHRAILQKEEYRGNFYRWVHRNNYPSGFRVLCRNCNCSKEIESVGASEE